MMEVSRNDVNSLVNKAVRDIETRLPDLIAASVVQSVALTDATSGITGELPSELEAPVSILDDIDKRGRFVEPPPQPAPDPEAAAPPSIPSIFDMLAADDAKMKIFNAY